MIFHIILHFKNYSSLMLIFLNRMISRLKATNLVIPHPSSLEVKQGIALIFVTPCIFKP